MVNGKDIAIILLSVTVILFIAGVVRVTDSGITWGAAPVDDNGDDIPAPPPPVTPPTETSDLTLVFAAWITLRPDAETNCELGGGTWHWEHDFVGCEGAGPADCATGDMGAMYWECALNDAVPLCTATDAYCKR